MEATSSRAKDSLGGNSQPQLEPIHRGISIKDLELLITVCVNCDLQRMNHVKVVGKDVDHRYGCLLGLAQSQDSEV